MADFLPDSDVPWELLAKHLAGEASASEQQQLHHWLAVEPSRLQLLTDATRTWERGRNTMKAFTEADVEPAWQRFRTSAGLAPTPPAEASPARVVPMWSTPIGIMRIAAALALCIGVWGLMRAWLPKKLGTQEVTVAAGPKIQLTTLPDGSRVWVNRNSTLTYGANFNGATREVRLQGEAFFEVKKDHGRPFTVLAHDTRTRVLGTSFNVRAYPAEDSVEVAVVTGRVSFLPSSRVKPAAPDSLLLPGRRGVIYKETPLVVAQHSITDFNFRAWQRQELVFDNQPLREVAQDLARYYGTPVKLARPALGECRFTGSFRQVTLSQALHIVSLSAGLTVAQSAEGYVLDGAGCR
ncbi:FecR family protein [Hymenobacter sp. GOD-10R]|uniref:FecR family protein n=1 Tax=Hymenobacter sp. GOD-10R TaxID=3093922 RepID=UPI002D78949C|nr:FecR domain-containing protein [Hymenobacter sp. GOD-10R]WRQ28816.1 FecR domain-containing protein [Hymenobacter sp. GOD-10R]